MRTFATPMETSGRRRAPIVALVLALAVLAGVCVGDAPKADRAPETPEVVLRSGGTVVYAADSEPKNFNLRSASGNDSGVNNVMRRVWPSVWRTNPASEFVLDTDVVSNVEMTPHTPSTPQTIVYRINPAAKWSDDRPISAEDFIYAWKVQQPDAKDIDGKPIARLSAPGEDTIDNVSGSADGKTVTVTLKQPFVEWKAIFSRPLVPAHIAQSVGFNTGFQDFDDTRPIGGVVVSGGPFRIKDFKPGNHLTLVRNEKFWGKAAVLDAIVFRFLGDSSDVVTALSNGDVDLISPRVQMDVRDRLLQVPNTEMQLYAGLDAEFLDMNTKDGPLSDGAVRRAFALSIDRQEIVTRTVGTIDPGTKVLNNRIFANSMSGYTDNAKTTPDPVPQAAEARATGSQAIDFHGRNVAEARRLLEGSGFAMEPGKKVYAKGGRELKLTLGLITGDPLRLAQAELVQARAMEAGFDVEIREAPTTNTVATNLRTGVWDVANLSQGMSLQPSTTDGSNNIARYSNGTVDDMYNKAKSEFDDGQRMRILNDIDRIMWQDMPRIPLYQRPAVVAYRDILVNVVPNASSSIFWNADTWALKVK
jgi:peptide/nickel transport system substrate-binding protein